MEDPANLELLVREDVALQQLVLAAMGTNPLVVAQAVKVLVAAGAYAGAAKRLVKHNAVRAIMGMLDCTDVVGGGGDSLQHTACGCGPVGQGYYGKDQVH